MQIENGVKSVIVGGTTVLTSQVSRSGNYRVPEYTGRKIVVWSKKDDEYHYSRWNHGATVVISVTSNLVPSLMRQLMLVFRLPYVPRPLAKRVEFVNLVKQIRRENFVGEHDIQGLDDDEFVLVS
ncbi:4-hydroxy-tetrahydrodipicolinate synthase [Pyrus ussuriensis x Pyrus communis]|uniref:4-hydroxy-tetrahydrodipicolinate synthase n=1 Tax=Pyrus ussuriensis x Pyrus communis TaxID=2448454 RepID=A0A5N5I7D7_9ROSA|nr:4-hydroxy-tetrahydrodipicolinate synthase [Pyrus ussuriensis x Pyrus communis]